MSVTVHNGDCLAVLPTLAAESVDAVVTDPPYFLPARHYATRKDFARSLSDLVMVEHFFRTTFAEIARVLKPAGCVYAFCDGQSYPVLYAMAYRHFRAVRPIIWDKVTAFNGYSWRHQHELILFAEREAYPAVKTGDGDIIRCRAVPVGDRVHPAEKPVELLRALLRKSVPAGGVVLDPFAGGGSLGEAARREGLSSVLIESEPDYHAAILSRLARPPAEAPPQAEVA